MSKEKHDGDPMEGYATGKQVQFNMEWYDKLRASRRNRLQNGMTGVRPTRRR